MCFCGLKASPLFPLCGITLGSCPVSDPTVFMRKTTGGLYPLLLLPFHFPLPSCFVCILLLLSLFCSSSYLSSLPLLFPIYLLSSFLPSYSPGLFPFLLFLFLHYSLFLISFPLLLTTFFYHLFTFSCFLSPPFYSILFSPLFPHIVFSLFSYISLSLYSLCAPLLSVFSLPLPSCLYHYSDFLITSILCAPHLSHSLILYSPIPCFLPFSLLLFSFLCSFSLSCRFFSLAPRTFLFIFIVSKFLKGAQDYN